MLYAYSNLSKKKKKLMANKLTTFSIENWCVCVGGGGGGLLVVGGDLTSPLLIL